MSFSYRKTAIVFGAFFWMVTTVPAMGEDASNPRLVYEIGYNHLGEQHMKNGLVKLLPHQNSDGAMDDFAQAEQAFEKAIEINATCIEARINLAKLYQLEGEFDQAAAQYDEVLRLAPDDTNVLEDMALLQIEMGDTDNASRYLDRAKRLVKDEHKRQHLDRYVMNPNRSEHSGIRQANTKSSR
jgi:tetratricopeptide (TPR) repeat protein